MPDPEDKEKEVEPSAEEKDDKPSEFTGGPEEAAAQFFKEKAEKEEPSEKETEEKPEEKPSEETKEEVVDETPPDPHLWIVDKDGNKTPLIVKADGKFHAPDKVDKALQWGGLGVHANTVLEGVKTEREEFEKSKPILDMILTAFKDGKLVVDGKPISAADKEALKEEIEEEVDETKDPEVEQLKKSVRQLQDERLKQFVEGEKGKIDAGIVEHRKANFGANVRSEEGYAKEVWDILTEKKPDGSGPKYTVEEAMKISHDSNIAYAKKLIAANPEEFAVDENAIYAKKLKEKEEKEEAPVGAPSETPVAVEAPPGDMKDFKGGPAEAYELFVKQRKGKVEAGKKT
jgi:hypothetical protein